MFLLFVLAVLGSGPAALAMIIGGSQASFGQFPFMCYVSQPTDSCSCVYIGNRGALTAAHCIKSRAASMEVYMGDPSVAVMTSSDTYRYQVSQVIKHSEFNLTDFFNDIAVLLLEEDPKASLLRAVQAIPLARPWDGSFTEEECTVVGYGRTIGNLSTNGGLHAGKTRVISKAECQLHWKHVKDNNLCTRDPPRGACRGDSGGALVCDGKLAGIVSYGKSDCSTLMPTVFASVSKHFTWIQKVLLHS